jgi:hypothetical protein
VDEHKEGMLAALIDIERSMDDVARILFFIAKTQVYNSDISGGIHHHKIHKT